MFFGKRSYLVNVLRGGKYAYRAAWPVAVIRFLYKVFRGKLKSAKMAVTSFWLSKLLLLVLTSVSFATPLTKRGPDDDLAAAALANAFKVLNGTLSDGSAKTTCTKITLAVRKE